MKILCLGGAGFIGSHLTGRLLKEGHTVIVIDKDHSKIEEWMNISSLRVVKADIRQPEWGLFDLVQESDLVIDLIAYANPGLYVKMPLEVFRLNFTENLRIAESCATLNKRLIQFSTCEVYGKTPASFLNGQLRDPDDPTYATFSEDSTNLIMGPVEKHRWIYASAKQLLERVLHAYGMEQGLNYSIIRPFNFIGPKIDFFPSECEGIPRVFSFFMDALLHGGTMKLVDGGHHRRCYTYIDDAIDCIYKIILNINDVCDKQIFNIGTPENEISIQDLALLMKDLYVKNFQQPGASMAKIQSVSGEEFYGKGYEDSDRRIPDIAKAKTLLGWEPKWKLNELLFTTMESFITEFHKSKFQHSRKGEVRV